jgi:hypothetical protein
VAREIAVWCDIQFATDERVPGETVTVALNGAAPVEIDLCDDDRKRYVEPLAEILRQYGAPASHQGARSPARSSSDSRQGRPPSGDRHLQCLWCSATYAAQSGYLIHLRKRHGFDSLADAYGEQCPLCGQSFGSLGAHTTRSHEATQTAAFILARDQGDPHGVVARRLAAGAGAGS